MCLYIDLCIREMSRWGGATCLALVSDSEAGGEVKDSFGMELGENLLCSNTELPGFHLQALLSELFVLLLQSYFLVWKMSSPFQLHTSAAFLAVPDHSLVFQPVENRLRI